MKLEVDTHVHTIASGHGYSTIAEIVSEAEKKGLKGVAIADHGPAIPGGAHSYHFWNLRVLPREMEGIRLYKSIEANVLNIDGEIDLEDEALTTLDLVQVGLHPRCGFDATSQEEITSALIKAMENPYVDVVVHPGNPKYPIVIERFVQAAQENQILLELNNFSFQSATSRSGSYESELKIARTALAAGLEIIVGSDAHLACYVGEFDKAIRVAEEAGFTEDKVLNSSLQRIEDFVSEKRKKLPK